MSTIFKNFIEDVTAFGSSAFFIFLILLFMILGELKLSLWLFIGLVLSFAIVIIIRFFYFKDRPNKKEYKNIIEKINASSFPSLHSWRIVMILVFVSFYYKSFYLTLLTGIMAILVFFSRVYLKKHFWIDVIFGAIFGFILALLILMLV